MPAVLAILFVSLMLWAVSDAPALATELSNQLDPFLPIAALHRERQPHAIDRDGAI
jgi:hypothetical protein